MEGLDARQITLPSKGSTYVGPDSPALNEKGEDKMSILDSVLWDIEDYAGRAVDVVKITA